MKPGATTEVFTSAVAKAGEKPDDIHIPKLNPSAALVSLILGGNFSTSQVQNGPMKEDTLD